MVQLPRGGKHHLLSRWPDRLDQRWATDSLVNSSGAICLFPSTCILVDLLVCPSWTWIYFQEATPVEWRWAKFSIAFLSCVSSYRSLPLIPDQFLTTSSLPNLPVRTKEVAPEYGTFTVFWFKLGYTWYSNVLHRFITCWWEHFLSRVLSMWFIVGWLLKTKVNVPTTDGTMGLLLDVVDSTRGPMVSQDGKHKEAKSVLFWHSSVSKLDPSFVASRTLQDGSSVHQHGLAKNQIKTIWWNEYEGDLLQTMQWILNNNERIKMNYRNSWMVADGVFSISIAFRHINATYKCIDRLHEIYTSHWSWPWPTRSVPDDSSQRFRSRSWPDWCWSSQDVQWQ